MKRFDTMSAVGGSALLVIFAVLCLTIFGWLSLSAARANSRLCEASKEAIADYYRADTEAEYILAQLRGGYVPEGVREEEDKYYYECRVSDRQKLVVEAKKNREEICVMRWQMVSAVRWEEEEALKLWDGTTE